MKVAAGESWSLDGIPSPDERSALWTGLTIGVALLAALVPLTQLRAHFSTEPLRPPALSSDRAM